jgi:hypothetical protein
VRLSAANHAHTVLDGGIDDSTTTIDVVDATVFGPPPFRAVLAANIERVPFEIVEVIAVSGNELTVAARGSLPYPDDTGAFAWDSGTVIAQEQTAGFSEQLVSVHDPAARLFPTIEIGDNAWVTPGWGALGSSSSIPLSGWVHRIVYVPVFTARPLPIDRIGIQVMAPPDFPDAESARLGIYRGVLDGPFLTPGELQVDAGTVDITSTGIKDRTIDTVLEAGYSFLTFVMDAPDVSVRLLGDRVTAPVMASSNSLAGNLEHYILQRTSGSDGDDAFNIGFPATAPTPDAAGPPQTVGVAVRVRIVRP